MAKLSWDKSGERLYETGVKNCALYVRDESASATNGYSTGVAWNGVTSITESPSGAEASPVYADDIKYLNLISAEDFSATINAYTYPEEFEACDGLSSITTGVTIGQQKRKSFCLAYKTTLGNDTESNDYGYKLHIIYGATASPAEKEYAAINDSPEASEFSWEMSTTPVNVTGHEPTAAVTIDSTRTDKAILTQIEEALFGGETSEPHILMPDDIIALGAL